MKISQMINNIKLLPDCIVLPPLGIPVIKDNVTLPDDIIEFYQLCGGIELGINKEYSVCIITPMSFVKANPIIIGEIPGIPNNGIPEGDISENWYIVADCFNGDYITIDLNSERLGKCYNSFFDIHPGNCDIIAFSFTDLLEHLIDNYGDRWYWLKDNFKRLGNPYQK